MATAVVTAVLDIPVELAWERVGDFGTWHTWNPRIAATELTGGTGHGPVGAVRHLVLADGSTVEERLERYDAIDRSLAYSFFGPSPFPVRDYLGQLRLRPLTAGGTFVEWWGTFDAESADEGRLMRSFEKLYGIFIEALGAP